MSKPVAARVALSLPGGGLTGAMYQVGALAALEDGVLGLDINHLDLFIGHSSGAPVAAALAGGITVERLYRALLDPSDNFFPLERKHLLKLDMSEWRRSLSTAWVAMRHATTRLTNLRPDAAEAAGQAVLLEQLDRFTDSLPAGLFSLDSFERFLAEIFLRRSIPNSFRAMPRNLRVGAYDIDSGERVVFGGAGYDDVPVSLACAASAALPLFFSPVRIGDRHFFDGSLGNPSYLDVAEQVGADLTILVSPLVPVTTQGRGVPTGHGVMGSMRDKGLLWLANQAMRIGAHARIQQEVERVAGRQGMQVIVLEPDPSDAALFLHNPNDPAARRAILEFAYRTTRERMASWIDRNRHITEPWGWRLAGPEEAR